MDEQNREYVDVCLTQQDLDGCLASAAWLRTSQRLLKGDTMMRPMSLEPIFNAGQEQNEYLLKAFAQER